MLLRYLIYFYYIFSKILFYHYINISLLQTCFSWGDGRVLLKEIKNIRILAKQVLINANTLELCSETFYRSHFSIDLNTM